MATVRKRSWESGGETKTAWVADYFDQEGKRHIKTFKTKRAAVDCLASSPIRQHLPDILRDGPLSIYQIRLLGRPLVTGIYFLFSGTVCQYIGQSENVLVRIETHKRNRLIPFDDWVFLPTGLTDLDATEATYIRAYHPPFNRGRRRARLMPPAGMPAPVQEKFGMF
jgi:hypothetical protein